MKWVLVLAYAGCGRIAFDAQVDGDLDGPITAACEAQWFAGPMLATPQPLTAVNVQAATDFAPVLDHDGLTLYFASDRDGEHDVYVTTRPALDQPFGAPQPVAAFTTATVEYQVQYSRDRLEVFYNWTRDSTLDVFRATRTSATLPFGAFEPVPGVSATPGDDYNPHLSYDERRLYFAAIGRTDNLALYDLFVAERTARDQPFGAPRLMTDLSGTSDEGSPTLTATERVVVFASNRPGSANLDVWYATRSSRELPFDPPQHLPLLSTPGSDYTPFLRPDGCELIFARSVNGIDDLWVTTVL